MATATFMVGYDLDKPGQNYDELIKRLKSFGTWWHCLDSTWFIVRADTTARAFCDELLPFIDRNDKLLVQKVGTHQAAWYGFDKECSDWLMESL